MPQGPYYLILILIFVIIGIVLICWKVLQVFKSSERETEKVKQGLRQLVQKGELAKTDRNGTTILMTAAREGYEDIIDTMLDQSADVDQVDHEGATALHYAAVNGWISITKKLIEAGAEIDRQDKEQRTPLWFAALNGYTEIVKFLINHGANTNIKEKTHGLTPLMVAAMHIHPETVQALLKCGANPSATSEKGWTALTYAQRKANNTMGTSSTIQRKTNLMITMLSEAETCCGSKTVEPDTSK